jgi:hypothetical protein
MSNLIGNIAIVLIGIFVQCHGLEREVNIWTQLVPLCQHGCHRITIVLPWHQLVPFCRFGHKTSHNFVTLAPAGPILLTWSQPRTILSSWCGSYNWAHATTNAHSGSSAAYTGSRRRLAKATMHIC